LRSQDTGIHDWVSYFVCVLSVATFPFTLTTPQNPTQVFVQTTKTDRIIVDKTLAKMATTTKSRMTMMEKDGHNLNCST